MRGVLSTWILWAIVVVMVTAQAPGDEDVLCTELLPSIGQNVIVYPPNVKPLMDSSHYEDLLLPAATSVPPVWQEVDNDNNNPAGLASSWIEQAGEACQTIVTVCGFSAGVQDNWLITQFINRTVNRVGLPQVRVQFNYRLSDCPQNVAQGFSCQRIFGVHKYERSSVDPAAARVTSNYVLVNRLTTRDTVAGEASQNETQNIDFTTDSSGFYLGVRDESTCILIERLLVYYHVCPSETVGLVVRPETIAPSIGSGMQLEVTANCIANARPISGESAKLTCEERGVWFQPSVTSCVCNDGFIASEDGLSCPPCDPGTYARVSTGMCEMCPNNSNSTVQGSAECPCDDGFYRLQTEIDLPCTQPPSKPRNVTVVNVTDTSVVLSWEEPAFEGGRNELEYILWYMAIGETGRVLFGTVNTTMGQITGLAPGVSYTVFVTAENDISDQVPESLFNTRAQSVPVATIPEMNTFTVDTSTIFVAVIVVLLVVSAIIVTILTCTVVLLYKKLKHFETHNDEPSYDVVELRSIQPALPVQNRMEMEQNDAYMYAVNTQAAHEESIDMYEYIEPDSQGGSGYEVPDPIQRNIDPVTMSATGKSSELLPADCSKKEENTPMAMVGNVAYEQVAN